MSTLGTIVSKTAPLLGSVLNTFLPGSGLVVQGLVSLFGLDKNASESDLTNAIQNDPEAALKLRQFEMQHEEFLYKAVNDDRASARDREKSLVASTGKRDWVIDFLAIFITLAFFGLCLIVAFTTADGTDRNLFYMLLGTFSTTFGGVIAFYFGGNPMTSYPKVQNREPELPPPAATISQR